MTDPATAYAESVIAGDILAGELVRLACERHLRDQDNQAKLGLLWQPQEAADAYEFIALHHHFKTREFGARLCTCDEDPETCQRRIELLPWQSFVVGSLFGWYMRYRDEASGKERWIRRFNVAYVQVARKNGKTHLALPVINKLTFADGVPGAEGYIAGTAQHQSFYIHHDLLKPMIRASPALRDWFLGHDGKLSNVYDAETSSKVAAVSSEAKNLDALSPYAVLLDELHEHPSAAVRNTLKTGMGAHRGEGLLFEITTAGEEREGSICKAERDYGELILRQDVTDERFFAFIAELDKGDDWRDLSLYEKCNPSLGVTVLESELAEELKRASSNPLYLESFKIKRANMWISVFSGMFDADKWLACDGKLDLKALRGRECFAGLDLAESIDMSALALVFPPMIDGVWSVPSFFWLPRAAVEKKAQRDRPIRQWVDRGLIEVAGENRIDFNFIRKRLEGIADQYIVREIGFDRHKATQLVTDLERDGFPIVAVPYGPPTLGRVTDHLIAVVEDGKLNYDNNPVLRWNAKNCRPRVDAGGNAIPGKGISRGNIDGISATIIALSRALAGGPSQSIYNPGTTPSGRSVYNESA